MYKRCTLKWWDTAYSMEWLYTVALITLLVWIWYTFTRYLRAYMKEVELVNNQLVDFVDKVEKSQTKDEVATHFDAYLSWSERSLDTFVTSNGRMALLKGVTSAVIIAESRISGHVQR